MAASEGQSESLTWRDKPTKGSSVSMTLPPEGFPSGETGPTAILGTEGRMVLRTATTTMRQPGQMTR